MSFIYFFIIYITAYAQSMNCQYKTHIDARQHMMIHICRRFMYKNLINNNNIIYHK